MILRAAIAAKVFAFSIAASHAQAADMACVIPNGGAAAPFCVDDSGIVALEGRNKPPFTFIRHVAVCGARLMVANSSEIAYREGTSGWTKLTPHGKSLMQSLGCDAKGAIFIGHKDGIARFEGGQWTDTPYSTLNVANGMLDGVKRFVARPDGSLWAVLGRSLARYEGGAWKPIAERPILPNENLRFTDATVDKDGKLWLLHSGGLTTYDGTTWASQNRSLIGPAGIAVDNSGTVWVALNDGIHTFASGTWKRVLMGGMEALTKPRDLAFDGKGRLWMTTSWGFGVAENNVARFWRMSNSEVPFDDTRGVVMAGKGPTKLPAMQDKPTGGISGKLESESNSALADVRVELCNLRLSRFSTFRANETPCSSQAPLTFSTRTDKAGAFSVDKVPPGDYSIIVEREANQWVLITGSIGITAEFVRVASGKVTTIPTITVKSK